MNFFLRSLLITFSALLFFTACNEDNIDTINVDDVTFEPDESYKNSLVSGLTPGNSKYAKLGCVEIDYPFSLKVENDQTITVQNYSELQTALDATSGDEVLDLELPLQGRDHNGVETTFADSKSLGTSYMSCVPGAGWTKAESRGGIIPAFLIGDYCLDLAYPVNMEDGNGNAYIAEDVIDIITYRLQNDELYYTLPLQVKDEGRTVSIESLDSMFDLFASCEESKYNPLPLANDSVHVSPFDCFTFAFPIDVRIVIPDTIATLNSEDDLTQLYLSGVEYELIFPVDVVTQSGMTVTISEPADFIDVLIDCDIIVIDTTNNACEHTDAYVLLYYNALNIFTLNNYPYDINYPATLIVEGTSVTLNSDDDFIPAIGGNPSRFVDAEIVYPVTVTQFGRTITLNDDNDVCAFYETLLEPCENKPSHIQYFHNTAGVPIDCAFFVDYPLEIINNAGNTVTISNRDDYLAELDAPGAYDAIELVYPVTGIDVQTNQQITFANGDDICQLINQCQ